MSLIVSIQRNPPIIEYRMLGKRKEYFDQLLNGLRSLEERVRTISQSEALPFSFFRESFEKTQELSRLLHELELMQVDDMKHQMERLVVFLSENENHHHADATVPSNTADEERSEIPETAAAEDAYRAETHEPTEESPGDEPVIQTKPPVEAVSTSEEILTETSKKLFVPGEGNRYADGITLPEYKNPRKAEPVWPPEKPKPLFPPSNTDEKPVIPSLNDVIQAPPAILDLKRSISLNDRFLFQRELFHNDRNEMNSVMISLNAFESFEGVERYLRETRPWDFENQTVKDFLRIIQKGFE